MIKKAGNETLNSVLNSIALGIICNATYLIFLVIYWPLNFLHLKTTYDAFVHHYYIILPFSGWELWPEAAGLAGLFFPFSFAFLTWVKVRKSAIKPLHPFLLFILRTGGCVAFLVCVVCFLVLFSMWIKTNMEWDGAVWVDNEIKFREVDGFVPWMVGATGHWDVWFVNQKQRYRIRNSSEYNAALIKRGSLIQATGRNLEPFVWRGQQPRPTGGAHRGSHRQKRRRALDR